MLIIQLMDPAERLQYRKGTLIRNTAIAINKMSNIFNMDGLGIRFTGKTPSLVFLNKLFSNDAFKSSWNKITLDGIEFNSEIVNFFLNMADPFKEFQICHSDMPLDFKHKNAFKFGSNDYGDARWVTLNDILKIRYVENVTFARTTLTSNHVRHFISYWINCPDDMFSYMSIIAMETIQLGGLFNELIVLEYHDSPRSMIYFTLAKSTTRDFKLLFIYHEANYVVLTAREPSEVVKYGNLVKEFKNVYKIMELLEKKKTLEKEFEETTDATKWRELSNRIQESKRRIHELGVVYLDGRATI
ncbi:hypothetical protein CRE_28886 [Caenorhabditis remanei]|uniref:Uncharacterized protein n=1 Tax=Caenorhabditis remanei TaxID=31234 RepID=E3MXC8_CAERE|nr:hypothetical protein CRE_28886 [Caenorhabditis remanei]